MSQGVSTNPWGIQRPMYLPLSIDILLKAYKTYRKERRLDQPLKKLYDAACKWKSDRVANHEATLEYFYELAGLTPLEVEEEKWIQGSVGSFPVWRTMAYAKMCFDDDLKRTTSGHLAQMPESYEVVRDWLARMYLAGYGDEHLKRWEKLPWEKANKERESLRLEFTTTNLPVSPGSESGGAGRESWEPQYNAIFGSVPTLESNRALPSVKHLDYPPPNRPLSPTQTTMSPLDMYRHELLAPFYDRYALCQHQKASPHPSSIAKARRHRHQFGRAVKEQLTEAGRIHKTPVGVFNWTMEVA